MPYGGTDLKLISFMGYKESPSEDKKCILKIRFYFPYSEQDSLFIVVKEIVKSDKYYSMSPFRKHWQPNSWQEFDNWPIKDVLLPLEISTDDIGILGRLNKTEGHGEIVPMHLYHSLLPDSVSEYLIHFKTQGNLKNLHYELLDLDSDEVILSNDIPNIISKIIYSMKLEMTGEPAGRYRLTFKGEIKNRPDYGPFHEYEFYHNPIINN
jgi:hypothetical protein